MTGEVFVDRVVEHLENGVVETPLGGGVADVHPGAFADRVEALQLVDLRGVVITRRHRGTVVIFGFGHGERQWGREGKNRGAEEGFPRPPTAAIFGSLNLAKNLERSRVWSLLAAKREAFFHPRGNAAKSHVFRGQIGEEISQRRTIENRI
jgi:hypothetical protein